MESRLIVPNGERIRELRVSNGMTQEKLAAMSNVNRRTIQRAEKGAPLQAESLADIAAALKVQLPQISRMADVGDEEIDELEAKSLVVLRPTQSGMNLINTIRSSFDGTIACDAEPSPENVETLTGLVSTLEQLMPQPWSKPMDEPDFPLSARLRVAVVLTEQLRALAEHSIAVFTATYTAKTQRPRYDMDEGEMYITNRTPFELVSICKILIAPAALGDRMTLKVNDLYVKPRGPAFETPEELQARADKEDDDIPF